MFGNLRKLAAAVTASRSSEVDGVMGSDGNGSGSGAACDGDAHRNSNDLTHDNEASKHGVELDGGEIGGVIAGRDNKGVYFYPNMSSSTPTNDGVNDEGTTSEGGGVGNDDEKR